MKFVAIIVPVLFALGSTAYALPIAAPREYRASTEPAALMRQAAGLGASGKYDQAADIYSQAAQAYEAAGQTGNAADAYKLAASMSEKAADAAMGGAPVTPAPAPTRPKAKPAHAKTASKPAVKPARKPAPLPAVAARGGHIVGRAATVDGAPVPEFTVLYSGFEDGKLASEYADGSLAETINSSAQGHNGRYSIKVPPGAYRASAYVTYHWHGSTYYFEMYQDNPPAHHDYEGLGLDKLRGGLVRNFRLSMTGKKPGVDPGYEEGYYDEYYGGLIRLDAEEVEYTIGVTNPPSLVAAYPKDSQIEFTLVPQGPLVDGSTGSTVVRTVKLGDDGKWFFCLRAIPVGQYSVTARLSTPDGQSIPLRLATKRGDMVINGGGHDSYVMHWQNSLTLTFQPNDIGPQPCYGAKRMWLYVGE